MIRAACAALVMLALLTSGPAREAQAQSRAVRFALSAIGDSTIEFRTGDIRWLRPGLLGVAVDPRRRDELIARFRVQQLREGSAVAVITGQTTALTLDHVALLDEPRRRAFRSPAFWIGILVGGALGFIGASALH